LNLTSLTEPRDEPFYSLLRWPSRRFGNDGSVDDR
jgi:hypothetical protein